MKQIPTDARQYVIQQSVLIAEDFLAQGILDNTSLEPVVTTQDLFWRYKGKPIKATVALCYFMGDYVLKIIETGYISEDEYANMCIDFYKQTNSS